MSLTQLIKIYKNTSSMSKDYIFNKLVNNEYDDEVFNEVNDEPLVSIIGNIHDFIIWRNPNIKAVKDFDLNKYLGKWYEIARYLSNFQDESIISAEAEYKINDKGSVDVINTGTRTDGTKVKITGKAIQPYGCKNVGKLSVSFLPLIKGNYWIIILCPNYTYSVVTDQTGKYLWILSRTTYLWRDDFNFIINKLYELGFDLNKLVFRRN